MGKYISSILCVFLCLFAVSTANAGITAWECDDDGDGAIVMNTPTWTVVDAVLNDYDLEMSGVQEWFPAHLFGDFTAAPGDPTVRIIEDITNQTSFAWTDYHITIGMSQIFSFVGSGLLAPAGWTATVTSVSPGLMPNGGPMGYVGTVNYLKGPTGYAIDIDDTGTFGFKVSFDGSIAFSTEQIPTPEPTTILLLGLGAMSVIRRRR